jgi:photosystem II stability/assembly factor-like uncharacterized protein
MSLLLATREGLFLTARDGTLTALRDSGAPDADFLALARAPSHLAVCYAATTDGRVYRSHGAARSWEAAGSISGFEELSSLAVDPRDPDHLLAGMEPSALFRSDDGGRSWQEDPTIRPMSQENDWSVPWSDAKGHVRTISIDLHDPRRIYLAIEVGGVVRTEDGGESWENVHGGIHDDVHSVAVNPRDGRIIYAATRHGFGRSDDYGRTWHRIDGFEGQGYARPLAVDPERVEHPPRRKSGACGGTLPDQPERVFTAAATTGPGGFRRPDVGSECGIFRSDDGGLTWRRLTNGIPARFQPYVDAIDVDPVRPEHVALADSEGHVFESDDGGESWRATVQAPPVRRLLILPE